jgi:hypothetical protein
VPGGEVESGEPRVVAQRDVRGLQPGGLARRAPRRSSRSPGRPRRRRRGWAASSVDGLRPIDPVDPRSATRRGPGCSAAPSGKEGDDIQGHDRGAKWNEIGPGRACRRDPGSASPESFAPAARLMTDSARSPAWAASASAARGRGMDRVLAERPEQGPTTTVLATTPPTTPSIGLGRRDVGRGTSSADGPPTRKRPVSIRPHREDRSRIQPRSAPRTPSGARRPGLPADVTEPDDERQQRDVERPEDRRHPGLEAVVRVGLVNDATATRTIPIAPSSSPLPSSTSGTPHRGRS